MRDLTAILMSLSIVSILTLPIGSGSAQMTTFYTMSGNFNESTAPVMPRVMHPSKDFVDTFNLMMNYDNVPISNSSQGNVSGPIKTATDGNSIYVAWLGNINGINHVFMTISNDNGLSFTNPVELTSKDSGNATKLDICAASNIVSTAWQEKNSTSGGSGIFGSIRLTQESAFITSRLSPENVTATDPTIADKQCPIVFYVIDEGGDDPIERWKW
jgi:hypothetical protein